MFATLSHLWQHHRYLLSAFAIAVAVMLYFAGTTTMSMIYWMDPAHQDQRLEGWMTPRYVAHSYGLPPDMLGDALQLERGVTPRRISLTDLATETGMSMQDMQTRVDEAAAALRARGDE